MEIDVPDIDFKLDPTGWREFTQDQNGDTAKYLIKRGYWLAAMAKESIDSKTGQLAASIEVTFIPGVIPSVHVGSSLDYAYFVHEGTMPHEIAAPPPKMLRFKIRGRVVYARQVTHPGTRAQEYLSRHLHKVWND